MGPLQQPEHLEELVDKEGSSARPRSGAQQLQHHWRVGEAHAQVGGDAQVQAAWVVPRGGAPAKQLLQVHTMVTETPDWLP